VQRPRLRFLAEDCARIVVEAVRHHRRVEATAAGSAGPDFQGQKSSSSGGTAGTNPGPTTGEDAAA
jgi:hypothetical protein